MTQFWLGIDIARDKFDVHLLGASEHWSGSFTNNEQGFKQLYKWLHKRKVTKLHACMEATGSYGEELAYSLHQQGYQVSVVNPKIIKHYGHVQMQRNKTDKLDAKLIALYCQRETPQVWTPPTEAVRTLKALSRRLAALVADRTREKNRLSSAAHLESVRQSIQDTIAFYDAQIKKLEQQIQDHIDQHPEELGKNQALLVSIPGIGKHTAAVLLAELPDIEMFASNKQVTAFAGLTPKQLQSGQMKRTSGIYKLGSKRLRTALYFPAITGKTHNPILTKMAERLASRGITGLSAIAALMRKLLQLAYGVLKSQRPFDPNYAGNTPIPT
jgi:transposase